MIGGHVLGILVPSSWTDAVGISEHVYHWLAIVAGGAAGILLCVGALVLVYRRLRIDRIRATTLRSDWVIYPVLLATIVLGMLAPSRRPDRRVRLPRDGVVRGSGASSRSSRKGSLMATPRSSSRRT